MAASQRTYGSKRPRAAAAADAAAREDDAFSKLVHDCLSPAPGHNKFALSVDDGVPAQRVLSRRAKLSIRDVMDDLAVVVASPPPPPPAAASASQPSVAARGPSAPCVPLRELRKRNLAAKSHSELLLEALKGRESEQLDRLRSELGLTVRPVARAKPNKLVCAFASSCASAHVPVCCSVCRRGRRRPAAVGATLRQRGCRWTLALATRHSPLRCAHGLWLRVRPSPDPNFTDADGRDALAMAVRHRGCEGLVRMLLDSGAHATSEALELAQERGLGSVVAALVQHGALPSAASAQRQRLLDFARLHRLGTGVQRALDEALWRAVEETPVDVPTMQAVLAHGATVDGRNDQGMTPLLALVRQTVAMRVRSAGPSVHCLSGFLCVRQAL